MTRPVDHRKDLSTTARNGRPHTTEPARKDGQETGMPRLTPLSRDEMPEFEELFVDADRRGREVPNLLRTLARKPEILKALRALRAAALAPGSVSPGLCSPLFV